MFTVFGEPASKANSRKLVTLNGKPRFIKSKKALEYERTFLQQCPEIRPMMEGDLRVEITIYYASRRPDLDESVILDSMQARRAKMPDGTIKHVGGVYLNDRQVKEKLVRWGLDRDNPRAEIMVETMRP